MDNICPCFSPVKIPFCNHILRLLIILIPGLIYIQLEKIILVHPKCEIGIKIVNFSNIAIAMFDTIAPHKVITMPTLFYQKLSLLISLLIVFIPLLIV